MNVTLSARDGRTLRAVSIDGYFEGFLIVSSALTATPPTVTVVVPDTWEAARVTADLARLHRQGIEVVS